MSESWEAEHEEFKKLAAKLEPRPDWIYGFFQVHPDAESPDTRLPKGGLQEFLVPERHLSLKLFFDNLRNYAICAAFAALGAWVWGSAIPSQVLAIPAWVTKGAAALIWLVAAVFLALNCAQTWLLTRELTHSIRIIQASRIYLCRGFTLWQKVLTIGYLLYFFVTGLLFSLLATLLPIVLVSISIGFVVYAVLVKQVGGG